MQQQVQAVVGGSNFQMRGKIRAMTHVPDRLLVIHAIVTSRLDYHNGILIVNSIKRLQPVQNNDQKGAII